MDQDSRISRARRFLGWKQWAWATGIAVAVSISLPILSLDRNAYWAIERVIFHTPWLILFGYMFLLAIAFVESGPEAPNLPLSRYIYAVGVVSALCIALTWGFSPFIPAPPRIVEDGRPRPRPAAMDAELYDRIKTMNVALNASFDALLATLIYVRLRNSRLAARALAQAELARSEASRSLLASQLDDAQAEVDPTLVIEGLEAIERAYDADPAAAEARLDELIAFLRGAIPKIRAEGAP